MPVPSYVACYGYSTKLLAQHIFHKYHNSNLFQFPFVQSKITELNNKRLKKFAFYQRFCSFSELLMLFSVKLICVHVHPDQNLFNLSLLYESGWKCTYFFPQWEHNKNNLSHKLLMHI